MLGTREEGTLWALTRDAAAALGAGASAGACISAGMGAKMVLSASSSAEGAGVTVSPAWFESPSGPFGTDAVESAVGTAIGLVLSDSGSGAAAAGSGAAGAGIGAKGSGWAEDATTWVSSASLAAARPCRA